MSFEFLRLILGKDIYECIFEPYVSDLKEFELKIVDYKNNKSEIFTFSQVDEYEEILVLKSIPESFSLKGREICTLDLTKCEYSIGNLEPIRTEIFFNDIVGFNKFSFPDNNVRWICHGEAPNSCIFWDFDKRGFALKIKIDLRQLREGRGAYRRGMLPL